MEKVFFGLFFHPTSYLLNTYYMPDTVLGTGNVAVSKVIKSSSLLELLFCQGETDNKQQAQQTHT